MTPVRPLFLPPPYQDSVEHGRLILRDGSTASLRLAVPGDAAALAEFFHRLSPASRLRRFFSSAEPGPDLIARFCNPLTPREQLTLVVTRVVDGALRVVATGSYFASGTDAAEAAFAVDDALQGLGIGSLLLERLVLLAAMHGFLRVRAVTRADNNAMIEVFAHSGYAMSAAREDGFVDIELAVHPGAESVARAELRDRVFTAASLRPFFHPRAVAVVGASRDPNSIGYRIVENLVRGRFAGPVYPVNPRAGVVCSIRTSPTVRDLPEPIDLAVIAVPAAGVAAAVDDCAARGVRAIVVISAGFAETDLAGRRLQEHLLDQVRGHGMRMVGPNCLGLINTAPDVHLNASFAPVFPPAGRIAMSSQSGALGLAILAQAHRLGLGLSTFVSVGNKADVTGNDLLQYWEEDPGTDLILLYLESFGNPRRFARIARRVSRKKPIVCVKSGRTAAGDRAVGSHTAALATNDAAVEALFQQTGVIRAETLGEMCDLASLLGTQPRPRGRRVGILTNAGGPGILCTDACEAHGLVVPELSADLGAALRSFLPPAASVANPVDMIASARPEQFQRSVMALLTSGEIDALAVLYVPVTTADLPAVRDAIAAGVVAARGAGATDVPVLTCFLGSAEPPPPVPCGPEVVPVFAFPEALGAVLARVTRYDEWRRQPPGMIPAYDGVDAGRARSVCAAALSQRGPGWLTVPETRAVLTAYGLPTPPGEVARDADTAVALARAIHAPVALKLASTRVVHKTEAGGVALGITGDEAVRRAFAALRDAGDRLGPRDPADGVLVQPMIAGGLEVMIGVVEDPRFGPLMAFGLGGIHVEILADVCFRVTPLTDRDADDMIRGIRGARLLDGYRGHPPGDVPALRELLLRTSLLVEEVPEIRELDLNPIFALAPGQGCRIADARIAVAPVDDRRPARAGPLGTSRPLEGTR